MSRARRRTGWAAAAACCFVLAAAAPAAADSIGISGLGDLSLGQWYGRGDLAADDWHCIRTADRRARGYRLEAAGDGPGGRFTLRNGAALVDYTVYYDDGGGLRRLPGPGRALHGLQASRGEAAFRRCRGGASREQKRVRIEIREADLARAPAGRFTGSLFLMVVAE